MTGRRQHPRPSEVTLTFRPPRAACAAAPECSALTVGSRKKSPCAGDHRPSLVTPGALEGMEYAVHVYSAIALSQ